MAILSRLPLAGEVTEFSALLWRDLPGNISTHEALPAAARDVLRLSTTGHWSVPLALPDGRVLRVMAYAATPPVFDGPEDRNGRRNHDETAFWSALLDGRLAGRGPGWTPPAPPFVILGDANLDPVDGDGRGEAMRALLSHPALHDPGPRGGGEHVPTPGHKGDPARDTADWPDPGEADKGPGNLRVDYVLPSADLAVTGAGVDWPPDGSPLRHGLVWVDIDP